MPTTDAYEWLDGNMHRNYPIGDSCTCVSSAGIMLPSSFLVDIDIMTPLIGNVDYQDRFFISGIARSGDSFTVEISYHSPSGDYLCARSAPIASSVRNSLPVSSRTFALHGVSVPSGDYSMLSQVSGTVMVGSCIDMEELGNLTFPYESGGQQVTSILGVRVHRVNYGLASISFQNSASDGIDVDRQFTLKAGDGVEFELQMDGTTPIVTVKRVQSMSEYIATQYADADALVADVLSRLGQPIQRINGIAPDDNGNFELAGDDCTTITQSGAGLFIQNPCAKPCCGDQTPLDAQAAIENIEAGLARLQSYYEAFSAAINSMQAKLASLIVAGR